MCSPAPDCHRNRSRRAARRRRHEAFCTIKENAPTIVSLVLSKPDLHHYLAECYRRRCVARLILSEAWKGRDIRDACRCGPFASRRSAPFVVQFAGATGQVVMTEMRAASDKGGRRSRWARRENARREAAYRRGQHGLLRRDDPVRAA